MSTCPALMESTDQWEGPGEEKRGATNADVELKWQ